MNKKAVVLFSGGLDSTTCLGFAKQQGFDCYALSFSYSQRHVYELDAACKLAKQMHVKEHRVMTLDIGQFGGSALTDTRIDVPDYSNNGQIPVTYVPARNTVFLAIALSYAEAIDAHDIYIGVNALDYSGYPDCRPEFITAFQQLANLATKAGVEGQPLTVQTPLLHLSKAAIIQAGIAMGIDYALTVSCYNLDEQGRACGRCDSCILRRKGFAEAGVIDPTLYMFD